MTRNGQMICNKRPPPGNISRNLSQRSLSLCVFGISMRCDQAALYMPKKAQEQNLKGTTCRVPLPPM